MNKKKWSICGVVVLVLAAAVFVFVANRNSDADGGVPNGQDYFNAEVLAVHDDYVEVKCLDVTTGAITEGTQLRVTKNVQSENGVPSMEVGDIIRVVFSEVMETDPPRLGRVWGIYAIDADGNVIPSK